VDLPWTLSEANRTDGTCITVSSWLISDDPLRFPDSWTARLKQANGSGARAFEGRLNLITAQAGRERDKPKQEMVANVRLLLRVDHVKVYLRWQLVRAG
jgi:hypothetical protein